ncbi:MAG TPA: hypothetical protein EYQ55_04940 [Methylococcaceae bacterium]|nr:hypothetical protein [Methylococcaceae bacterium]
MKYIGYMLIFLSSIASAEELYFCSDNQATGFKKKSNYYMPTTFNLQKFELKILDDDRIQINSPSMDSSGLFSCIKPIRFTPKKLSYDVLKHWKSCTSSNGYLFNFNATNKRYVFAKGYGYVFSDNAGDAVAIRTGTCSKD